MNIGTLKKLLKTICDKGYAEWEVCFCTPDGESYYINHIYVDENGNVCLQSTDYEETTYDFTVYNILKRLNNHYPKTYVYFEEEFEDGSRYSWDIMYKWYKDSFYDDKYEEEVEDIIIDCYEM